MKQGFLTMALFTIFFILPITAQAEKSHFVYLSNGGINISIHYDNMFVDYDKIYDALIHEGWKETKSWVDCDGLAFSIYCASFGEEKILVISVWQDGGGYGIFLENKEINSDRVIAVLRVLSEEYVLNLEQINPSAK